LEGKRKQATIIIRSKQRDLGEGKKNADNFKSGRAVGKLESGLVRPVESIRLLIGSAFNRDAASEQSRNHEHQQSVDAGVDLSRETVCR
jgi:hypothetical protein